MSDEEDDGKDKSISERLKEIFVDFLKDNPILFISIVFIMIVFITSPSTSYETAKRIEPMIKVLFSYTPILILVVFVKMIITYRIEVEEDW